MSRNEADLLFWFSLAAFAIALPRIVRLARMWIVLPIRAHGKKNNPPAWQDTSADELSPEMQEFLGNAVLAFRGEGFEVAANLHSPASAAGAAIFVARLVNRSSGDLATVSMAAQKFTRAMEVTVYTQLADGRRMNTISSGRPRVLPRDPHEQIEIFPPTTGAAELCEIHRRRLERAGMAGLPRAPFPDDHVQRLGEIWDEQMRWLVRCGYHRPANDPGRYRPTWKGAFLITWRQLPPLRGWRLRRQEERGRRVWLDLGMQPWRESRQPDTAAAREVVPPAPLSAESAAGNETPSGSLVYEAALKPNEIRFERSEGRLIVRAGTPTAMQILARSWLILLSLAFLLFCMGLTGRGLWNSYLLTRRLPPQFRALWFRPQLPLIGLLACGLLVAYDLRMLFRTLSRARGTMVVVTTRNGIRFSNSLSKPREGFIDRASLAALVLAIDINRIGWKLHRLVALRTGAGRIQVLLLGRDARALESARAAILEMLGIERAAVLPEPLPV